MAGNPRGEGKYLRFMISSFLPLPLGEGWGEGLADSPNRSALHCVAWASFPSNGRGRLFR